MELEAMGLSSADIKAVLDSIDVGRGRTIRIDWSTSPGMARFRLTYNEPDVDMPEAGDTVQRGRWWYIDESVGTADALVKLVWLAVTVSDEHQRREHFTVDGVRLFSPHRPLRSEAADVAQSATPVSVPAMPLYTASASPHSLTEHTTPWAERPSPTLRVYKDNVETEVLTPKEWLKSLPPVVVCTCSPEHGFQWPTWKYSKVKPGYHHERDCPMRGNGK